MSENAFRIELLFAPVPFRYQGKITLVYEVCIHNDTSKIISARDITVSADGGGSVLQCWGSKEIAENSHFLNAGFKSVDAKLLEPGNMQMFFFWLSIENEAGFPTTLLHLFVLEDDHGARTDLSLEVMVQTRKPLVIQPPLRGKQWWAAEAASNHTGHRRTPILIDGSVFMAQRYAADWLQLGEDGRLFSGTPEKNENWYCYGADLLAVADGTVSMVNDGMIENVPQSEKRAVELNLQNIAGNLVIIDLGGEHFAAYAHILPGSITVKVGERVKCGQVIGKLGNSGNSDAPHLHFHIGDRNSVLGTHGLPYHLAAYEWIGNTGNTDEFLSKVDEGQAWHAEKPAEKRKNEYMGYNDVVNL
jgi:hypothetical protein